jgi:hypothetical protein
LKKGKCRRTCSAVRPPYATLMRLLDRHAFGKIR